MKNNTFQYLYPSVNKIVLLGFCAYIMIWFSQAGERMDILGSIRLEALMGLGLLLVALVYRFSSSQETQEHTNLSVFVIVFFLVLILHVITSQNPQFSWLIFVNRILKFSVVAIFISTFVKSPSHLRYFFAAFLFTCFYITQESFRAALDGSMVWENQGIPRLHGGTSLYFHPNSLAGLATGTLPFIWFLYPNIKRLYAKIFLLGLTLTSLAVIMYSGSRTAYVGLIAFALFLFWVSKKKIGLLIMFIIIVSVAIPFIPPEYKARFMTIFTGQEIEGASMGARMEIIRDAWAVFKRYPLGVGVSAFPFVRIEMFGRFQDTHNLYLEVLTNLGVHGFIIFSLLVIKILRTFQATVNRIEAQLNRLKEIPLDKKTPENEKLVLDQHITDLKFVQGSAYAGMGYIVIRLALGMFGMDLYEIYWWVGIGLAIATFNISVSSEKGTGKILKLFDRTHHHSVEAA